MKKLFIPSVVIFFLWVLGCTNVTGFYFVHPILEIEADTTMITAIIPEGGQNGWQTWDTGVDTVSFSLTVHETKGYIAYVTGIEVKAYDANGDYSASAANIDYIPPKEVEGNGELSIGNIDLYITERIAGDIENADPNNRIGYLKFVVKFYDENVDNYESLPFYVKLKVMYPTP